ncbi:MAG TPA: hypothetical protein VMB25_20420 [Bryobacteraceae bacterium]|nr:hypothetical protein [Bryobacteraceae bacterium]
MKFQILRIAGMTLLVAGMAGLCLAQQQCRVPEINASTASNALALLGGAVMMLRGRKR